MPRADRLPTAKRPYEDKEEMCTIIQTDGQTDR
jgi:hypothetical protein